MYTKFIVVGLHLAALAVAGQIQPILPRQTDEVSATGGDAPKPTEESSSGGSMSSDQCTSKLSSLFKDLPQGVAIFMNETNSYYKTATATKGAVTHTDCGWLEAIPTMFVKEPAAWLGEVRDWTAEEDTKKVFEELKDGCEDFKDKEELPTCYNETMEWLMEKGGLSEETIHDLMGAGSITTVSTFSLAVIVGAVAALL